MGLTRLDGLQKKLQISFTSPKTKYTLSSNTPQLEKIVEWLNINKDLYKRNKQLPKTKDERYIEISQLHLHC